VTRVDGTSVESAMSPRFSKVLAFVLLGLSTFFVWRVVLGPYSIVPLTDFGRDLLGADAVRAGLSPYQRVGDLVTELPTWSVMPEAHDYWIAHSPFAIAFAGFWSWIFGTASESVFRVASWFAFGFIVSWMGLFAASRYSRWDGLAIAAAASMSFGLPGEIWYLNGASLAALGLIGVFVLETAGRRTDALLILGVLVAWRPWLAPVALFLPNRNHLFRDLFVVGLTATILSVVSVGVIGGISVLSDWVQIALPGNFGDVNDWPLNMSLTGSFVTYEWSTAAFAAFSVVVLFISRHVDRGGWWTLGVIAIVVGSPLVWPQHLWNLTPLVVFGMATGPATGVLAMLLLLSTGVAGSNPMVGQIAVAVFCIFTLYALRGHSGDPKQIGSVLR
jgi:hypothetical protein